MRRIASSDQLRILTAALKALPRVCPTRRDYFLPSLSLRACWATLFAPCHPRFGTRTAERHVRFHVVLPAKYISTFSISTSKNWSVKCEISITYSVVCYIFYSIALFILRVKIKCKNEHSNIFVNILINLVKQFTKLIVILYFKI